MPNTRLTSSVFRSAAFGLCAVYAFACSDHGLAPLPPGDGPLTGKWIQPSIDTWIQLDLSQSGTRVVGYHSLGSANFGGSISDSVVITGSATLPHVILQWTDSGEHTTMDATLSASGDSLTGTWSTSGQPAVSFRSFHRAPNPSP